MPAAPVLDSHALLALLRDEPGGEAVVGLLERASQRDQPVHMTEVNYAEVQYIVRRKDGDAAWARSDCNGRRGHGCERIREVERGDVAGAGVRDQGEQPIR